ncbi:MAG: LamG domain-containing protein, partial [Anaerolineae bacterium]|nr:LamG domain-containing protein [Anaerolineae bacterium]
NAIGPTTSGGGIASFGGTSTLTNVTISGNRSYGDGGGILLLAPASMTLTNVTITANIADDDAMFNENGGGFQQSGAGSSATFNNTVIAGNDDRSGISQDDCNVSGGTVTSNGYNMRYVGTGCDGVGVLNNVNDITSTPGTLGLGPLQENGGPTPTHDLLTGSDAIDRVPLTVNGCTTTVTADQRGVTRADGIATGTLCDVGAVEYVAPVVPSTATGGNGPGGVGVTDGSSTLDLWLQGDEGVYTDTGCSIVAGNSNPAACWADQSGNNNHATQSTGGTQPIYTTSALNGQPILQFDGGDDVLNLPNSTVPTGNSPYSVFALVNADVLAARGFLGSGNYGTTNQANAFRFGGGGEVINYWWGNDIVTPGGSVAAGTNYVLSFIYDATVGREIWINGTSSATNGSIGRNGGAANNTVGKTVGGEFWDGNIVETILYATPLNATTQVLVENYLSAKYNIAVANDVYDGDTPGNGDFDLDVAGIGQLGGNQHTQAYSVGMVVRNRSFLQDDGDWLLFGHHTAVNSNTTK